ncbi:MAG: AraC family transcriptional regulator [Xanthobacteraceae bacterium]|nr:AraC family transcriptional regulator [Xanthobacteraceae bacterium]
MPRHDPRNRTRYWSDPHTPGLSLMCADFTTQEFPPHVHEAFVLAVTEAGGAVIQSRGVAGEARPSRLYVLNPDEPQSSRMGTSAGWRYRAFYLPQRAIDAVARGLGIERAPYFLRNDVTDRDLIESFLALHRALEDGNDPLHERELMIAAFGSLFGRHGSGGRRAEAAPRDRVLLARVMDVMRGRYAETLQLDALAGTVGLTAFQLIGLFKRTTGLTPHACLTQVRLNAACRLLERGTPIAEAALACGFYDQAALTKHFKRCYGITPLQFARAAA